MGVGGDDMGAGMIVPRADAVWVTPEQMQMIFRASNGNVLAQSKNSFGTLQIALHCSICGERLPIAAVNRINALNMVHGDIKDFLDAHLHPIVEETKLPNTLPQAKTGPSGRRIKDFNGN